MKLTSAALIVTTLGCGPSVGDDAASASGSESTAAPTPGSSSDSGTTTTLSATAAVTTATPGTTDDAESTSLASTGEAPTCIEGVFEGISVSSFETAAFTDCERGLEAWFDGAPFDCPMHWVRVEGTLCGPGSYGHLGGYLYELSGAIIVGPCENTCDEAPRNCGTEEEICSVPLECSPEDQDCLEGETCVPASFDGDAPWNGAMCRPDAPGGAAGDPCTRDENDDDCGPGLWCVPNVFGAPAGECVGFCSSGSCPGECTTCSTLFANFDICTPSGEHSC